MSCSEIEALLSAFLDGELDETEAVAVESHLAGCVGCRRVEGELAAMVGGLGALASVESGHPAASWMRIEAMLAAEGPAGRRRRWMRWLWPSLGLGLAAAMAVIAVRAPRYAAPSDEALWRDAQAEFRHAEDHYLHAIDDLHRIAARERATWPDERRRRFDDALAALDRASEVCREAARSHPDDPDAEELLFRAYREQITFLENSLLRAASSVERAGLPGGPR